MIKSVNERKKVHLGFNIRRLREIMGIKQFALAENCEWSQQQISKIENSQNLNEKTLEKVSKGLGVPPELILGYTEDLISTLIKNVSNSRLVIKRQICENFELSSLGFSVDVNIVQSGENLKEEYLKSLIKSIYKLDRDVQNIKENFHNYLNQD